jgi:hypothetical protein
MQPLFQSQFLRKPESETANEEEQIISSSDEDADDESNAPGTPAIKLTRAEQAQIAHMIGDTMVRLNRLSEAVSYYETARSFETAPAVRKTVLRKLADARAALRVQHRNAARQPLLHEPLEQDRVVRPRLLARVTPAPKVPSAKGGVKQ